jgi:hypothetical protein
MTEKNEIKIVRVVVKLSSMLENLDKLKDNYNLPPKMFTDLYKFDEWFNSTTNELMVELFKHKEELLSELIGWFNDYENRYSIEESLSKQITLFRAKCFSAIRDCSMVIISENIKEKSEEEIMTEVSLAKFALVVSSRLNTILDKGYFKRLEYSEKDFIVLYESMNDLGDKIMGSEKKLATKSKSKKKKDEISK